jgi:hypothetical protein
MLQRQSGPSRSYSFSPPLHIIRSSFAVFSFPSDCFPKVYMEVADLAKRQNRIKHARYYYVQVALLHLFKAVFLINSKSILLIFSHAGSSHATFCLARMVGARQNGRRGASLSLFLHLSPFFDILRFVVW